MTSPGRPGLVSGLLSYLTLNPVPQFPYAAPARSPFAPGRPESPGKLREGGAGTPVMHGRESVEPPLRNCRGEMGRLNPVREEHGAKPIELTHSSVPQSMLLPPRPPRPVAVARHPPPAAGRLPKAARPAPPTHG